VLLKKESSHGARENKPPPEAGVIDPPGAPYIGSPGDKRCPTIHYACTLYTVAELTTGVLSARTILGTMHCVMVMGLSHRCLSLEHLVFVF
jgi:hypothetical protein